MKSLRKRKDDIQADKRRQQYGERMTSLGE